MWAVISMTDTAVFGPFKTKERAEEWIEAQKKYGSEPFEVRILNKVATEGPY